MKQIITYILLFIFSVGLCLSLLLLSAKLPKESIRDNMQDSADYLCEKQVFFRMIDGVEASIIDRYADSILLNVAWHFDEEKPLESVIWSSYYYTAEVNENDNLKKAVFEDVPANKQYLRYWHGSTVIVRLLHLVTDIKGMYVIHALLLIILFVVLMIIILKRRYLDLLAGLFIGLIITNSFYVPYSLEYTWVYIIMLIASIVALRLSRSENETAMGALFLVTGVITNYLDFLTAETLTLLVPLIIVMYERLKNGDQKNNLLYSVKQCLLWGIGYAGMWISKWLIASVVIHENSFKYVKEHIDERIGGSVGESSLIGYIFSAIIRNISDLFPIGYGSTGKIIFGVVVFIIIYLLYVYRSKDIPWKKIGLYLILGLIPYIRYAVLHEHSFKHDFFTCRAQLATILAITLSINEIIEWRYLKNAFKRNKR